MYLYVFAQLLSRNELTISFLSSNTNSFSTENFEGVNLYVAYGIVR